MIAIRCKTYSYEYGGFTYTYVIYSNMHASNLNTYNLYNIYNLNIHQYSTNYM